MEVDQLLAEKYVQKHVCNVNDIKPGEKREFKVENGRVLLVRDYDGNFYSVGHRCTHFGAPLVKGVLRNGTLRCSWHGACFSIKTGDIEDFPGLDSLPKHEVFIRGGPNGGKVFVRTTKTALANDKRCKLGKIEHINKKPHILIIGGGPASLECAETLREHSFQGKITIATRENHLPYDRTRLSKEMTANPKKLYLRDTGFYEDAQINISNNMEATGINITEQTVTFAQSGKLKYDKLVIATGGRARTLGIPGVELKNVFVLRTPDDANSIATCSIDKNVVICGASFIGMEVASSLQPIARKITICDFVHVPFEKFLGRKIGQHLLDMHKSRGIEFAMGVIIVEMQGDADFVQRCVLNNGDILEADVVITGVGIAPQTEYLQPSGISLTDRGFVNVDKHLRVITEDNITLPNVFAAGDIAFYPQWLRGWEERSNVQHWQMAHYHGRVVGINLLAKKDSDMTTVRSVPYFWTQMYGISVRYCGYGEKHDHVVIKGDLENDKFVAFYTKGEVILAVATMNTDPVASECAQRMMDGSMPHKQDIDEIYSEAEPRIITRRMTT